MTEPIDESTHGEASQLRHRLASPLSALLSEAQLALMDADSLPEFAVDAFRDIERLALKLTGILKESRESEQM